MGSPSGTDSADVIVVRGAVESGDQRGRLLGFPTANIGLRDQGEAFDADGVWAGWVDRAEGTRLAAAVSVGRRPTYYGSNGRRLLEAYLLDFDGDLYGEMLTVWLVRKLRRQRTYASTEEIVAALSDDVALTARLLGEPDARLRLPARAGGGLVSNLAVRFRAAA